MRTRELQRIMKDMQRLTSSQRREVMAILKAAEAQPEVVALIERRMTAVAACPHCGCSHIVKNGSMEGSQRYKFRGCSKSFNALAGTPMARLRLRGKWPAYAKALCDGLTLRDAAKRVGINIKTAFLWRHRFMAMIKSLMAQQLNGIAEADETYFLRSHKGQRKGLNRPPRHRGGKAAKRGLSAEQVAVMVARDRAGETDDFILPVVDKPTVLATLKPILAAVVRAIGIEHHAVNLSAGIRVNGVWHVQNVNSYHSRLKGWLCNFRGVATK